MKNLNLIIGVSVVIIFIFFVSKSMKAIAAFFGFDEEVDFGDTPYVSGESASSFDELPMVSKLTEVLDTWFFIPAASPRCQVYRELLELTDNEFIKVMNTYKDKNKRTVRQDMNAVIADGCPWGEYNATNGTTAHYAVFDRMDELDVR